MLVDKRKRSGGKKVVGLSLNQSDGNRCSSTVVDITFPIKAWSHGWIALICTGETGQQMNTTETVKMTP